MRDSYALVLSGGGAKGVYHIGVWKALREIGVEVDAFVGSSAGAVAAAFLAQGLDDALEDLAGKIGLDWVLNIPECLVRDGEIRDEMLKRAEEIRLGVSRLDARSLRRKQRSIRRERDERRLPGNPYFYFLLAERSSKTRVRALLHRLLDEVFPELPSGVFFLEILEDYVKAGGEENPRRQFSG